MEKTGQNDQRILVKTLKELVYEYLRDKIRSGELKPGSSINLERTSKKLGVSRTPLRDALLQLECEGFVTIKPRKGIFVNTLTFEDIRKYYEIIGGLESSCIVSIKGKLKKEQIEELKNLNLEMEKAIYKDDFDRYYEFNLKFHNVFLELCENEVLKNIVDVKKRRLYDFQRKRGMIKDWELNSIKEHEKIVEYIIEGNFRAAADYMRDVHWSYSVQEKYIKRYYSISDD